MNEKYIIQDMMSGENCKPFLWYYGNYSNKSFCLDFKEAKQFETEQEAKWALETLLKEFPGSYAIIKFYS